MSSSKPYKLDQIGIRMVKEPPLYSAESISSTQAAVRLMSQTLKGYDREVLAVVNLRNDLKPINMNIVSIGTLNQSLAHPREILKSIILSNAGSVMLFHNHPSGNLTPSPDDISLMYRMAKICELLGTPIVDHIIIGNDDHYYSFQENKILKVPSLEYARDVLDLHLVGAETVSEPAAKKQQQTIAEITDKLEQGVHELFNSERYREYLSTMAKFHNYSLNNTILISMQKPDATLVAGYQSWKKNHGRQVKRSEKGIRIIAPAPYKVRTEQDVIDPETMLEKLYEKFNVDHPEDFYGHSLSVSDVVMLRQNGLVSAHYVDAVGFAPLEGFYSRKNHLRTLEDMLEQNDNMLDGVVNNIPEETLPCKCEKKKESVLEQLNGMREKETPPFFGLKLLERNRE